MSLATLSGCETTTTGGAVGATRSQLMLVPSGQLDQMAAQSYAKLQSDATRKGALNQDHAMLQRVRTIASRLEPQTRVFRADAPGWKWEVNVIASNELNAFCMPGGKIMVYSGLINQLHLTDGEIAIVLGHEISHALREHSREQVSQAMAAQAAIGVGAADRQVICSTPPARAEDDVVWRYDISVALHLPSPCRETRLMAGGIELSCSRKKPGKLRCSVRSTGDQNRMSLMIR